MESTNLISAEKKNCVAIILTPRHTFPGLQHVLASILNTYTYELLPGGQWFKFLKKQVGSEDEARILI